MVNERVISIEELWQHDYALMDISVFEQNWRAGEGYNNYLANPRREHGLCLMAGSEAIYILKKGRKITAGQGEIVYLPQGSQYGTTFYQFDNTLPSDILINFKLRDNRERKIILGDTPQVIRVSDWERYLESFQKVNEAFYKGRYMPGKIKGIVYQILTELSAEMKKEGFPRRKYGIIEKGILYLEQNWTENIPVSALAEICGVSESCFRRLFGQYMGMSPVQYRNQMRISRARKLLIYDSATVDEVSRTLGFEDAAYFSRLFKKKVGCSPSRYGREREAGKANCEAF